MGAKTGIDDSFNWWTLSSELPAYRRWNVRKDEWGTKETLFYPALPAGKVRYKANTEVLTDVGTGSRRGS